MARFCCARWPFLKMGTGIVFHHGIYETDDEARIAEIEASDGYGLHILRVPDLPPAPEPEPAAPVTTPVSLDQPAEERWAPRVRQGGRGSR